MQQLGSEAMVSTAVQYHELIIGIIFDVLRHKIRKNKIKIRIKE